MTLLRSVILAAFIALYAFAADPFYVLESKAQGEVFVLHITDPTSFASVQWVQLLAFQDKSLSTPVGSTQFYIDKSRYVAQPMLWMFDVDHSVWLPPIPIGLPIAMTDGRTTVNGSGITYDTANVRKGSIALNLSYAPGAATNWFGISVDTTNQLQVTRLRPACNVPQIGYEFGCPATPGLVSAFAASNTKASRGATFARATPERIETLVGGRYAWYPADDAAADVAKLLAVAKVPE